MTIFEGGGEGLRETDLYGPLRDYLVGNGYTVRSEVKGCDVAATKGDELIVLEMKTSLNLAVIAQAVERQRSADSAYVVVPHPGKRIKTDGWRSALNVLKRLELGLILISLDREPTGVEISFHPVARKPRKLKRERRAILREVSGRSMDLNSGGSSRRPIATAYREECVKIGCFLRELGPSSPARLRKAGTGPKTGSILYSNYYGWFERLGFGLYALAGAAQEGMTAFPELLARYQDEAAKCAPGS